MKNTALKSRTALATAVILLATLALPALVAAAPAIPAATVLETSVASPAKVAQVALGHARSFDTAVKAEEARIAAEKAAAEKAAAEKAAAEAAAKAKAARRGTVRRASGSATAASGGGNDLAEAQSILASLKARYSGYLGGASVTMGDARGYQAISYYTAGRIVISSSHTASLSRILNHEIWHIIDWRDNGRIDWGESVPPSNAADFR